MAQDGKDQENQERLDDDSFENIEIIVQKDKEIDELKAQNKEKEKRIKELEKNSAEEKKAGGTNVQLSKQYQKIIFQLAGDKSTELRGKVLKKHKKGSPSKTIIGILKK